MSGNSSAVTSNQNGPHERLLEVVARHVSTSFERPIAPHNSEAFARAQDFVRTDDRPLCFDSFCGIGQSTATLAGLHPHLLFLGIDQSASRLARHGPIQTDNYCLLQADVTDFWRLASKADWHLQQHWLLYPNPWPKASHLQRRVHGSPVFPDLLALGGQLECRSNWPVYIQELKMALNAQGLSARSEVFAPESTLTAFESKYCASGHQLWRLTANLNAPSPSIHGK